MAASLRAASSAALDDPSDTLVVSKPTGTTDGDVLLFFTFWDHANSTSMSPPSGLTLQDSQTYGSAGYAWWYTRIASSEPSTYTFTNLDYSDDAATIMVLCVQDANTSSPVDDSATSTTSAGVYGSCPSVSPTGSDSLLLCASGAACTSSGSMGTSTPPSGMTLTGAAAQESTSYGGYSFADSAYEQLSSSGATGTRDFTFARSKDSSRNWSVAVTSATSGTTGTGSFALGALGSGGTGGETYTGTGFFALQALASGGEGTGGDTTGTGSFALQGLASGGSGQTTGPITGTGSFSLRGFAFSGSGGVISGYSFTGPVITRQLLAWPRHPLFSRIKTDVAITLLKIGSSYTQVENATSEEIEAADIAYIGGRVYTVTPSEAADLTAAGYGAYVS